MSSAAILTSTHLPGQLLELAGLVQAAELADVDANNLPKNDNMQISYDTENKTVTVTTTLPLVVTSTANGVTYKANDYLP
jgi:electron transfer flavoprotein alpha/beta subunit